MSKMNSTMEILKLLPKTNCKDCGEKTCLSFAVLVFKNQKSLNQCPHISAEDVDVIESDLDTQRNGDSDFNIVLEQLKERLGSVDLQEAAQRVGGTYQDERLTMRIFGKNFSVNSQGDFFADIHINFWLTIPVLSYVIDCKGVDLTGKWVPFRELKGGIDWHRFFEHKCEIPFKKLADSFTDLFEDLLYLFSGKQVQNHYQSDVSLVLYPLPRLPVLICYWKPEEGMQSDLNLFFDSSASYNLNIEAIYSLMTGMVAMFNKISLRHG